MVVVPASVVERFRRFSLYNSPYHAHTRGCAIDLYPSRGSSSVVSPVGGEVMAVRAVSAPTRSYADAMDYLVVVDTGGVVARLLHVDPVVAVGDSVSVGAVLGSLVTSGYAAPWVPDHLHVEFREHGVDPVRARGSLPIEVGVGIEGVAWDGVGVVERVGETFVVLDRPDPGVGGFVGVRAAGGGVLDGGFPHYRGGGLFGGGSGSVALLGAEIGVARGRDVTWSSVEVLANGEPVRGLSFSVGCDGRGVKVVCPGHSFAVGDVVRVRVG